MANIERRVIAEGEEFCVECAVRTDLTSPVSEFLDGIEGGAADHVGDLEPDEQIRWYDWFMAACDGLAEYGTLPHRHDHNQLLDGIWEIKHSVLRITFFDTDGSGEYEPLIDSDSYSRFTTRPWPDDFLYYLRLTTAFTKTAPKAPPAEIELAKTVRTEDLEHDRSP
ncbi:hypothetical protein AB6N24_09955 [Cellulomonas sp. 179-A 4D5 NHS]|uniref:hypothetical protein n=1 Tax=Cellulomonas sp. 179-A 4D5 NHS TaxID=3142378 RepID=UPI0039A12046